MIRTTPLSLMAVVSLFFALGIVTAFAEDAEAPPDKKPQPSTEQILKWVRDLDSDRFVHRETATKKLVDAGRAAIVPLTKHLPKTGLEVTTRGIFVLRELALDNDDETAEAARLALEKLSKPAGTSVARRASSTLAELDQMRQARAIQELKSLGAIIGTRYVQVGQAILPNVFSVQIGPNWNGKTEDLRRLRWLGDVQQIELSGPTVTDATLAHVGKMKNLTIVMIKRAKITNAGIAHLKSLSAVQYIAIFYCPVDDMSIAHLKVHERATLLKLYGTQISKDGAKRLKEAMANATIDHRDGAFLGVGAAVHPLGCSISIVQPDSSAAKAGLQVNDIIVKYDGEKVTDFQKLTQLIGANRAGEKVTIEVLRGEEKLTKKLTLGEWK
ncbi:MAG: PDZ domain-containing protein [Planctomycetes bacterium]|nr:PDZ domain-containing protein [Planctomycetota bacterium]